MNDYYYWKAQYNDGTIIPQYKTDGTATKWDELNYKKIKYWVLEPVDATKHKRIVISLNGKRPIYWRTWTKAMQSPLNILCYKFGWQDTVEGKNVKFINYIYPNGDIEQLINSDEPQLLQLFINTIQRMLKNGKETKK